MPPLSPVHFLGSDAYTDLLARAAALAEKAYDDADEKEVEVEPSDIQITVRRGDPEWKLCEAIELLTSDGRLGYLCVERHIGGESWVVWSEADKSQLDFEAKPDGEEG